MIRTIRKIFLGVLHPNVRLTDQILETVLVGEYYTACVRLYF